MGCDKTMQELLQGQSAFDKILEKAKVNNSFFDLLSGKDVNADLPKLKPGDIVEVDGVKRRVSRIDAMGEPVYNDLPKW